MTALDRRSRPQPVPICAADARGIAKAAQLLAAGHLVGLPTETVYGLAADASQPDAVSAIFQVKGRPAAHPLIVHLADVQALDAWCQHIPEAAYALAEACWPGPLTLVLNRRSHVPDVVTGGRDTVAVRVPAHPVAAAVLRAFGGGLAAPSANRFGRVSPTRAEHVAVDLAGRGVAMVLDGGRCEVGVESTIVDCTADTLALLRPGDLSQTALERILGQRIDVPDRPATAAPGQHPSHYAPGARVHLCQDAHQAAQQWQASAHQGARAGVLLVDTASAHAFATLPPSAQIALPGPTARAASSGLYEALREADARAFTDLYTWLPAPTAESAALRDRLTRAAAPRSASDHGSAGSIEPGAPLVGARGCTNADGRHM